MVQCYTQNNVEFDKNGDMTLTPTSCVMHAVMNGEWTLELDQPLDSDGRWKYIEENGVIKAPSFNGEQLFRIKDRTRSDSGITVYAEPIFLDAMDDCFLLDVRPTNKTGQEALNLMTASNDKYTAVTDIADTNTAYYINKNLIEAINGDDDNSFINRWGGEIIYDNYTIYIYEQAGQDNGVRLAYGRNLGTDGVSEEVDMRDLITRIIPMSYNGYMLFGDHPWVDSDLIDNYPTVHTSVIEFDDVMLEADATDDDKADEDITVCSDMVELREALKKRCQKYFEDEECDKPTVTIEVDMVMLQNTDEYANYQMLEDVSLGDTVHLTHSKLGITSDARVTELEYDCVSKKVTSVVIGDATHDYLDTLNESLRKADSALKSQTMLYTLWDSVTEEPDDTVTWTVSIPEREAGMFVWMKVLTTYVDGTTSEGSPICISGYDGINGSDGADAILVQISSSNGNVFKNNDISTVLHPVISYGNIIVESSDGLSEFFDDTAYIEWYEKSLVEEETSNSGTSGGDDNADVSNEDYGEDSTTDDDVYVPQQEGDEDAVDSEEGTANSIPLTDPRMSDNGFSFTISADDVYQKAVYICVFHFRDWVSYGQITLADITDGYYVNLSNDNFTFQGGSEGLEEDQTTTCLVQAFCGADSVDCKVGEIETPDWLTIECDDDPSTPTLTITATTELNMLSAIQPIIIPVTVDDVVIYKTFTYSIAYRGEQGAQGIQGIQGEKGEQGVAGETGADGATSYFHIKYSEIENPTSADDMTETPSAYIGTYVDFIQNDSDDPSDYTWYKWQGIDGADGIPGTNGADGVTYYLHIAYANSEDGSDGFSVSDGTDKYYIGQYTDTTQVDSTDYTKYTWTLIKGADGEDGKDGADGKDGSDGADGASVTISSTAVTYQASSSGTTTPTGTWSSSVPSVSNGQYLWTKTVVTYTLTASDGSTSTKTTTSYSVAYIGTDGSNGSNGSDGADGADGASVTISSTAVTYQASSSGTTTPTGTWSSSVPSVTQGQYLWTKTVVTYTLTASDGSTSTKTTTSYSVAYVGVDGADGADGSDGASFSWNMCTGTSDEWKSWTATDASNKTVYPLYFYNMNDSNLEVGDLVYVSFYVKFSSDFAATGTGTASFYIQGDANNGGTWTSISMTGGNQKSAIASIISSDEKEGYISTYFKVTSAMIDGSLSGTWKVGFRSDYYTGTFYYRCAMANVGTCPSAWAPNESEIYGSDGATGATGAAGADGEDGKMLYGTCSTSASTAAKVVTCSDATSLYAGLTILVAFSTANTASAPTLNVNSLGAKSIYFNGAVTSSSNMFKWSSDASIQFTYNGTYWLPIGYPASYYGTSSTAAATAAKTSTISNFVQCKGAVVNIVFTYANTAASPTLNVSSAGAVAIYTSGVKYAYWVASQTVQFTFDGQYWRTSSEPVYATTVTVGNSAANNVYIDSDSVNIRSGSTVLASFSGTSINIGDVFTVDSSGNGTFTGTIESVGKDGSYTKLTNGKIIGEMFDDMNERWVNWVVDSYDGLSFYDDTSNSELSWYGPNFCKIAEDLDVYGAVRFKSTLKVTGATTLSSTLEVTGATTLSSTLGVTGKTTLSGALAVTGAATLSSTLAVTGKSTLTGAVTTGSTITSGGSMYMPNAKWLYAANTSSTNIGLIGMNSSDAIVIGTSSDFTGNIYIGNNSYTANVYLRGSGSFYRGSFKIPQLLHGSTSVTPSAANTPTGVAVTFSTSFSGAPHVVTAPNTSVPGTTVTGTGAINVASTGMTVYLTRTNTTSTSVYWIAVYN